MKSLQQAITKFNKKFNRDISASIHLYAMNAIQVVIQYGDSNDSKFYFNSVVEATKNINQTYDMKLDDIAKERE